MQSWRNWPNGMNASVKNGSCAMHGSSRRDKAFHANSFRLGTSTNSAMMKRVIVRTMALASVGFGISGLLAAQVPVRHTRDSCTASSFHDWQNDPFTRGAYSYGKAGSGGAQQKSGSPVDETLFFAGEATDTPGHTWNGSWSDCQRLQRGLRDPAKWGHNHQGLAASCLHLISRYGRWTAGRLY